jgi:hypothetical protein
MHKIENGAVDHVDVKSRNTGHHSRLRRTAAFARFFLPSRRTCVLLGSSPEMIPLKKAEKDHLGTRPDERSCTQWTKHFKALGKYRKPNDGGY